MFSRRVLVFIYVFFIFFIITEARAETSENLEAERQFLDSELKLAKKPELYFIFNFKENRIYLKARGIVLKEFNINKMRYWGPVPTAKPYVLSKKTTLFKPRREKITPGISSVAEKGSKEPFIRALELADMPTNFNLVFEGNVSLFVRSDSHGLFKGIYYLTDSMKWYLFRPLVTVWNAIRGRQYSAIYVILDQKDTRALYWSFSEGTRALIYYTQN